MVRLLWPGAPGHVAASCACAARCASRHAAPSSARARSAHSASGSAGGCPTASSVNAGCARGRAAGRAAHHDCVCSERPGAQLGAGNVHVARGHVKPARERPPHGRQARPHCGTPPPRRGPRAPLQHFGVRQLRARRRAGIRSAVRQHQQNSARCARVSARSMRSSLLTCARTHTPQCPPQPSASRATALGQLWPQARRAAVPRPARSLIALPYGLICSETRRSGAHARAQVRHVGLHVWPSRGPGRGSPEERKRDNCATEDLSAAARAGSCSLKKGKEKEAKTARLEAGAPLLGQEVALHRERAAAALQQADAVRARL